VAGAIEEAEPKTRDPVSAFTKKWNGVPLDASATGTMQRIDLERLKVGKTPLTESQTQRAIQAADTRKPVTPVPKRNDPLAVWSNLTGDITDLVKGIPQLPMALLNEGRALAELPERLTEATSPGDIAQLPGVRLAPGAFTASALLPGGLPIQDLAIRPVSTVLDLLPFASGLGKLNAGAALQRAGIEGRLGGVPVAEAARTFLKTTDDITALPRKDRVGLQTAIALGEGRRFLPDLALNRIDPITRERALRGPLDEFRRTDTGQKVFQFAESTRGLGSLRKRTEANLIGGDSQPGIPTLKDLQAHQLGRKWYEDIREVFPEEEAAAAASETIRQAIADPAALGFRSADEAIGGLDSTLQPFAREYVDTLLPALTEQQFRDFGPMGRNPLVERYDGEVYLRGEANKLRRGDERLTQTAGKLTELNPERFAQRLAKRTGITDPVAVIRQAEQMFPEPVERFAHLTETFGRESAGLISEYGQLLDDRAAAFTAARTGDPRQLLNATRKATTYRRVSQGLLKPKEFYTYARPLTELRNAALARVKAGDSTIPARFTETGKRLFQEGVKESYEAAQKLPEEMRAAYQEILEAHPPGSPLRAATLKTFRESIGMDQYRLLQYRRPDVDMLATPLSEATFRQYARTFVDDAELSRIDAEVRTTLNSLRGDDYQPVYVPGVAYEKAPKVDSTNVNASYSSPDYAKARTFDAAPQHPDMGISVAYTAFEDWRSRFAEPYMAEQIKSSYGIRGDDLLYKLEAQGVEGAQRLRIQAGTPEWDRYVNDYINLAKDRGFVVYDPSQIFPTQRGLSSPTRDLTQMTFLPREMDSLLRKMAADESSYFQRLFDPVSKTFRTSVLLFSPAWHFNNILSGALMTSVTNPRAFLHMRDEWVRRGGWGRMLSRKESVAKPIIPTEGQRAIQFEGISGSLENKVISLASEGGKLENTLSRTRTVSRIWNEIQQHKVTQGIADRFTQTKDFSLNLNGFWDDMFRASNFDAFYEKQLALNLDDGMRQADAVNNAAEQALRQTQTIFMDWTQMLPVERGILRAVFPFYAWTSHIMRLAFKLPFDHPARVAIINNFTRAEIADWQSEYPQIFRRLLGVQNPETSDRFLGMNVDAFNPFRDVGNIMTMGGMVASSNPIIQQIFKGVGVDPMSGGPEYAPNFIYDPSSPSGSELDSGNPIINLAGSIIPQSRALARWAGVDEEFRALESSNPAAAQRMLLSGFRLPIIYRDVDVNEVLGKEEIRRFDAFRKATGEAKKGKGEQLARFDPALAQRLVAMSSQANKAQQAEIDATVAAVEGGGLPTPAGNPLTSAARMNVERANRVRGTQPLMSPTQFITV